MTGQYYIALVSGAETIVWYCEHCAEMESDMDNIMETFNHNPYIPKPVCDGCDNTTEPAIVA